MAGDTGPTKQERIEEVDAQFANPDVRAQTVWAILQKHAPELTDWDLVCFAANYLGWQSANFSWLEMPAKHICRLIYTAHYLVTEKTNVASGIDHRPSEPLDSSRGKDTNGERPRKRIGLDVSGGGFE